MENSEISGRIQMERFIPVEIFRKKSNAFRGITFFPFLLKRPKFVVPFVWITSARLHAQRKRKLCRYFVKGTTQSRSCFRWQKIYRYHLTEIFDRNFRTNGKCSRGGGGVGVLGLIFAGYVPLASQPLPNYRLK